MSYIPVKRPKFSLLDRIYVVELARGLVITLRHLVLSLLGKSRSKKDFNGAGIGACMPFPEQRWDAYLPPTTAAHQRWCAVKMDANAAYPASSASSSVRHAPSALCLAK